MAASQACNDLREQVRGAESAGRPDPATILFRPGLATAEQALAALGIAHVFLDAGGAPLSWSPTAAALAVARERHSFAGRRPLHARRRDLDEGAAVVWLLEELRLLPAQSFDALRIVDARASLRLQAVFIIAADSHNRNGSGVALLRETPAQPAPLAELPCRRRAVATELCETGRSYAQIADELGIAVGTVRKHVELVYAHFGVGSRAELQALVRGGAVGRDVPLPSKRLRRR